MNNIIKERLDWVKIDNVLSSDDCLYLIENAGRIGFVSFSSGLGNGGEDEIYCDLEIQKSFSASRISIAENNWLQEKLIPALSKVNSQFKFDLDGIMDIQVLKYNVGSYIKPHLDNEIYSHPNEVQKKVTFVIQLTNEEEYTGGDLRLHINHKPSVMPKKKGTLIAFPTYTLHDVTEILSGERYSCIGWCFGNQFK